ncbi:hypothetical protein N7462_010642 [Penicillium macrosclerotiorum]|uniref:uncharacterized protein n=1 Tax=Penicillium macrosclerotiorum TaxID=303699 RepID=UPI0025473061|nr:uncharacterized protein N7462_010642 [Penicillium macrosclerotiorum]KAJ5669572.1 hypothetical protein N7462_010642 [Penicillium macrosclerotiorum]
MAITILRFTILNDNALGEFCDWLSDGQGVQKDGYCAMCISRSGAGDGLRGARSIAWDANPLWGSVKAFRSTWPVGGKPPVSIGA